MDREGSPDWLRDFKSPVDSTFVLLSSSPSSSSREDAHKVFRGETSGLKTNSEVDEESPKLAAPGRDVDVKAELVTPKKRGRPAGKKKTGDVAKNVGGAPVEEDEEDDEKVCKAELVTPRKRGRPAAKKEAEEVANLEGDDEDAEKVVSSRRSRGRKLLDSDSSAEDPSPPSKSRRTASSAKGKSESQKLAGTSRNKKRLSGTTESPSVKRARREIKLEVQQNTDAVVLEDEDETAPISSLSKSAVLGSQELASASVGAVIEKKRPGAEALRALAEDEEAGEDALGLSQVEEPVVAEENGEPSERKLRRGASTLPLSLAEKVLKSKVLLECEDDALDLSGDIGAVGRFSKASREDGEEDYLMDLKGVIYRSVIVPSNTFFVVNVGQTEAKIEAIMNDYVQLRPVGNQTGDETLFEGTLEDFGFDLGDEGDGGAIPNGTPAELGDDEDDEDKPKKRPVKGQGKKMVGKGPKAKTAAKGGIRKPRAKSKAGSKKGSKAKSSASRKVKAAAG